MTTYSAGRSLPFLMRPVIYTFRPLARLTLLPCGVLEYGGGPSGGSVKAATSGAWETVGAEVEIGEDAIGAVGTMVVVEAETSGIDSELTDKKGPVH